MRYVVAAVIALVFSISNAVAAAPWKNQEEWIVSQTTTDIAEMLMYAAAKKAGHTLDPAKQIECHADQIDQSAEKYSISIKSSELPADFKREIQFQKCIYETGTYAKFAGDLAAELKLTAEAGSFVPSAGVVRRLSDNSMGALYEQNAAVSSALSAHPLNAELHEEAALVYGTFNMLDMSRQFHDSRFGVARAAAHLAIAQALRSGEPASFCGKLAETAQFCQSSRDTEATEHADALAKEATSNYEKSWARCMRIMGTNDPRGFDEKEFTPVEEYQYLKRVAFFGDGDKVVHYLEEHHERPNIQWLRLINNGCLSVSSGHVFTATWLPAELSDFAKDMQLWSGRELKREDFATEANLPPVRCTHAGELNVVSWPDVAFWHQRQILCSFVSTHYFYDKMYGVREDAQKLAAGGKKLLSDLTLFEFAANSLGKDSDSRINIAMEVIDKAPNLIPATTWFDLAADDKTKRVKDAARLWFGDLPLFGTAYDFFGYVYVLDSKKLDVPMLTKLRDLALYNRHVCERYVIAKYGANPTGDQWAEGYGKMLEFDRTARYRVAYADWKNPDKFIARMEVLAKQEDPLSYITIAEYCWHFGRVADTVKYYQLAFASEADSIGLANATPFWVNYQFKHGNKKDAEKWANFGAEVYSGRGLDARAALYELEGKLADAETWYKKIVERYEDKLNLDAFYIRHRNLPQYAADAKTAIERYYPDGKLELAETVGVSTAPADGARLTGVSRIGEHVGMKKGDVLVALNGLRVHNQKQTDLAQCFKRDGRVRGVYWNGQKYVSFDFPVADAYFYEGYVDYKPAAAKP